MKQIHYRLWRCYDSNCKSITMVLSMDSNKKSIEGLTLLCLTAYFVLYCKANKYSSFDMILHHPMKDDLRDRVEDALRGHDARYIEMRLDETDTTRVRYRGLELEEVACNTGIGNGEIIGRIKGYCDLG